MKSILQCVLIASVALSACNTGVDRVPPPPNRHTGSVQFTVLDRWGFADNYKVLHFRMAKKTRIWPPPSTGSERPMSRLESMATT